MTSRTTAWSHLKPHLAGFLEDESDPLIGSWAVGQGIDAPDRQLLREILRPLLRQGPVSLLEIGCGSGIEVKGLIRDGLLDEGLRYRGYDFTPEMVEVCQANFPGLDFEVRDLLTLDESETADVALARGVLEHIEDGETALRNLYRVSRRLAVVSWFMRPAWNDADVGIAFADGFVHQRYSMRALLGFVRSELRPERFYRFDFEHHVHPWSVWMLCKEPLPGIAEVAHSYLASETFERALLLAGEVEEPNRELEQRNAWLEEQRPALQRQAEEQAEVIRSLEATNEQLRRRRPFWRIRSKLPRR